MHSYAQRHDPPDVGGTASVSLQTNFAAKSAKLRPELALATGLAILGLLLRLYGLANKAFWYDEILTWHRAKLPFGALIADSLKHKHFPTYFFIVSPFAWAAHNPEWMLRLPSVLFGAVCVFLVTRLAFGARGFWAGLVAGLLMALSPINIMFAQDARPYALVSCCVLIAAWGLLQIAQNPQAAALPIRRAEALRSGWIALVLGTLAGLLVENDTIPFLLTANLAMVVIVLRSAPTPGLIRNWAWSQAIIALGWLPAVFLMWWMNRGAELDGLQWIPKATWQTAKAIGEALYLFRIQDMMTLKLLPSPLPAFGVLVAAAAAFGAWRLRRAPNVLVVIGLAFLTMPLAVVALAEVQPLLVSRYLLWSTGPFFVLAGIGVAALPARLSAVSALTAAIGGAISLAPYYSAETKPRWNEALTYLSQQVHPGDVIVAQNQTVKVFLVSYANRFGLHSRWPIISWDPRHPGDTEHQALAGDRAWIVYGRVGQGPQESETEFRSQWADFGAPAEDIRFGSSILILRFDHPPAQQPIDSVEAGQEKPANPAAPASSTIR
jgi:mannosyltransferase